MHWITRNGRRRVLPRESLYRRWVWVVIGVVAGWCLGIAPVAGQMPQLKRPEEAPVERPAEPTPKKLVNEPRAVGLLQLNKDGKGTLIPIAIRIDGKFYDASVYKADPVPMALDGGTVYEVEKTGESQGLFTVGGALHNQNPNSATPWLGSGSYVLNGTVVANKAHKAEDKPRGLDNDNDAPPRLTRGKESGGTSDQGSRGEGASKKTSTAPTAGSKSPGGNGPSSGTNSSSGSASETGGVASDDSGRPQLKRASTNDSGSGADQGKQAPTTKTAGPETDAPNSAGSANGAAASSSTAQGHGEQDQSPQKQSSQSQSGNQPSQDQNGQNYYRPTLRRGKPTESAPEDTPDELTRTTETVGALNAANAAGPGSGTAPKPGVQLVPAISDAGGPLPESYKFFWKEGEEDDRRKQMLALAANEVRAYLTTLAKDTIPAKTVPKSGVREHGGGANKSAAKIEPIFENIQFSAFDVWRNNQPVMVLTAEAHLPETEGSGTAVRVYYVTLAARTDIYGDLRKLYSGVTDNFHLDVTPRLQLIDAVDADGDGRGELLFRETTDAGNGYLIYRPTGDTLWKMFDSVNQE